MKTVTSLAESKSKENFLRKACFALFAMFFIFNGCDKDVRENGNVSDTVQLLETVTNSKGYVTKYEYDEYNRIAKINEKKEEEQEELTLTFIYNNYGDLVSLVVSRANEDNPNYDFALEFSKVGNIITFTVDETIGTFELNQEGLLVKYSESYITPDDEYGNDVINTDITTYEYQNSNVSKITFERIDGDGNTIYFSTKTFTYDDKKSPFYYCKTPDWFKVFFDGGVPLHNNVVNSIIISSYGYTKNISYIYTYNDDGFPLTVKCTIKYHYEEGYVNEYEYENIFTYIKK